MIMKTFYHRLQLIRQKASVRAVTRKVLTSKIGLRVGPDSPLQALGIENTALNRVVRLCWVVKT